MADGRLFEDVVEILVAPNEDILPFGAFPA
jgi:hypothetical protein